MKKTGYVDVAAHLDILDKGMKDVLARLWEQE